MKLICNHRTRLISMVLVITLALSMFPIPVCAANGQNIEITRTGQIVDTFNGVDAVYATSSNSPGDSTYSCAAYVKRYYSKIHGIEVSNLCSNCTPYTSAKGYSFSQISSGYLPGDIVRLPGHWAIIKEVNGSNLTLIEQNWKFADQHDRIYAKKNRIITVGSTSGLAIFRLYKNGISQNSTSTTSSELEQLLFDSTFYASIYEDLNKAYGNNASSLASHWKSFGIKEGRVASPFFDAKWYLKNNADVARVYGSTNYEGAYSHFINFGFKEGRQGSPYFSAKYYLAKYPDLKSAFGNDYLEAAKHFLNNGLAEGRQASTQFSIKVYTNNNPDVAAAYSLPLQRISHYIVYVQYGRETRKCI